MSVELTANAVQTVAVGGNVLFTNTPVRCNKGYVLHRDGSGLVDLAGSASNRFARYKVTYSGNIAVAAGGTVGEVSVALTVNGEPIQSSVRRVTPAAADNYFAVSATEFVDVLRCGGITIALENTSVTEISTQNMSVVIERIA